MGFQGIVYLNLNLLKEVNKIILQEKDLFLELKELLKKSKEIIYLEEIGLYLIDYESKDIKILGTKKLKQGKYRWSLNNIDKNELLETYITNYKIIERDKSNYRVIRKLEDKVINYFDNEDYFYLDIIFYDNWGNLNKSYFDLTIY